MVLFAIDYKWSVPTDENRAIDGIRLRYLFDREYAEYDKSGANILEVLIALARRCEEDIMQDPDEGDRTPLWFWTMFENLGLDKYPDEKFDITAVRNIIGRFLNREYAKNGQGSIFYTIRDDRDFRSADLWYQMAWYLDEHFYYNP